jgi:type II secretory pathway pseudopilin PulG
MSHVRPKFRARRGFTMVEALVGVGVLIVVAAILVPIIYKGMERLKRRGCEFNLHKVGAALDSFQSSNNGAYPIGSRYEQTPQSWWLAIMPFAEMPEINKSWSNIPHSGNFSTSTGNTNVKVADGLRPEFMFCPSSLLPRGNDPTKHISPDNRQLLGGAAPQGIPVPNYVAIAGSAIDMATSGPNARVTKDGVYGILSGTGLFPPNQQIRQAAIRDGLGNTMLLGEQSDVWEDESYDPPVEFDQRSSWPYGAFMGTTGAYGQLSQGASGIDGNGAERCFNITTIRYAINTKGEQPGLFADNLTPFPPPEEGAPPRPPRKRPPGPGHNQGLSSPHSGGAEVLNADGAVHWMSEDTDLTILQRLATRDDGGSVAQ